MTARHRRIAAVAIVLLVLTPAATSLSAARMVIEARAAVRRAWIAAQEGRMDDAREHAHLASELSAAAVAEIRIPALVLGWTPLRSDVLAVEASMRAVSVATRAGASLADELAWLVSDRLLNGKGLDVDRLASAAGAARRATAALGEALEMVDEAPSSSIGAIDKGVRIVRRLLRRTSRSVRPVADALAVAPDLLGGRSKRRYLVAFLNTAEARGGGGMLGFYAVVTIAEGRFHMTEAKPIRAVVDEMSRPIRAPEWFADTYGYLGALYDPRQVNLSPNFPVAARGWMQMYHSMTGRRLDGVISVDPYVVGRLAAAMGPLRSASWDSRTRPVDARRMRALGRHPINSSVNRPWNMRITPDNAERTLTRDIYLKFYRLEYLQNRYLRGLIEQIWQRLRSGRVDVAALMRGLARAGSAGHLKVLSVHPDEARVLACSGLDGDIARFGPDVQLVFHNNFGANKIDGYLRRTIRTRVVSRQGDTAVISSVVTMDNLAPSRPATMLLRPGANATYPPGLNRMVLSFLLPSGSNVQAVRLDGREVSWFKGRDSGLPMFSLPVEMRSKARARVNLRYAWPDAFSGTGAMTLIPQTGTWEERISFRPLGVSAGEARAFSRPGRVSLVANASEGPGSAGVPLTNGSTRTDARPTRKESPCTDP